MIPSPDANPVRSAVTNCILAILLALQLSACDRKPPPINPTGPDGVQDNQLMTREAFEQTVLTNGPLAFISISASWCGSCRRAGSITAADLPRGGGTAGAGDDPGP